MSYINGSIQEFRIYFKKKTACRKCLGEANKCKKKMPWFWTHPLSDSIPAAKEFAVFHLSKISNMINPLSIVERPFPNSHNAFILHLWPWTRCCDIITLTRALFFWSYSNDCPNCRILQQRTGFEDQFESEFSRARKLFANIMLCRMARDSYARRYGKPVNGKRIRGMQIWCK